MIQALLIALALTAWALQAEAQDFPRDTPLREPTTDDTIVLRESSEGNLAELFYRNHEGQGSNSGVFTRSFGDVTVRVQIEILPEGPERIAVVADDPGHVVFPADPQDVDDGSEFTFQVMLPMF